MSSTHTLTRRKPHLYMESRARVKRAGMGQGRIARKLVILTHKNETEKKWSGRRLRNINELTAFNKKWQWVIVHCAWTG